MTDPSNLTGKYILRGHKAVPEPDVIKWGEWFEKADRKVARTEIDNVKISTIFLGLDHSFGLGRSLLFETMVFGGSLNEEVDRYTTWEEAVAGHDRMVERVRHGS